MENVTREGVVVVIDDDAAFRTALKELFGCPSDQRVPSWKLPFQTLRAAW